MGQVSLIIRISVFFLLVLPLSAQLWDLPFQLAQDATRESGNRFAITFEQRIRLEDRTDCNFGADPDRAAVLLRTRIGLTVKPVKWLKLSGMMQDSRAPGYGLNAPTNYRAPLGLHEAYVELTPGQWEIEAGRSMMHYGEGLMIGTPQWGNSSRSYDHARVAYVWHGLKTEFLVVSHVKLRIDDFARPVLGERAWGTYNTVKDVWHKTQADFYLLRHDQNRPGGYLGLGRLATNSFGGRWSGPVLGTSKFSTEGVLQNGTIAGLQHRGAAWHGTFGRRYQAAGRNLDLYTEYNYASPGYDQVFAAHHDRFGHQDLFGWRNIHAIRGLATYGLTRRMNVNLMFDDYWLADSRQGLYGGTGKLLARSGDGSAGRHVGEEADLFGTYKVRHSTFGLGYGRMIAGGFLHHTTPGKSPNYFYVFHGYSF